MKSIQNSLFESAKLQVEHDLGLLVPADSSSLPPVIDEGFQSAWPHGWSEKEPFRQSQCGHAGFLSYSLISLPINKRNIEELTVRKKETCHYCLNRSSE